MLLLLNYFIVCGYFSVKEIVLGLTIHMNTMKRVLCVLILVQLADNLD